MDQVSKITCGLLRNSFCCPQDNPCITSEDQGSLKPPLDCTLDGNMHLKPSSLNMRFLWAWITKWRSSLPSASHKDHIMPWFYILWVLTNQPDRKTCLSLCKRYKLLLLRTFLHGNKLLSAQLQTVANFSHLHISCNFFLVPVCLSLLCGNWLLPPGR